VSGTATDRDGQTAGVREPAIAAAPICLVLCATLARFSVPDRSKREATRADIGRKFEDARSKERSDNLVRCRSCRKSRYQMPIMIEMGGFAFCSDCISAAYDEVAAKKAGRA
jgi:hypothetical protein